MITMRRLAAGLALLLLAGCATVDVQFAQLVTGRVTDETGKPVAGSPVLVVGRSLDLVTSRMEYTELDRKEARTVTDGQGQYRLEFIPANLGNNFYLFFYDRSGFDRVKYRRPEPIDITPLLKPDRPITVNQVLQIEPSWPEVERQIAYYGADSDRGKILRQHGIPEKRETTQENGQPADVWWYYTDGLSYWFINDKIARTQQFPPVAK